MAFQTTRTSTKRDYICPIDVRVHRLYPGGSSLDIYLLRDVHWLIVIISTRATQGVAYAPEWELSVGIWKVRFREKWNMGKTDDPQ
jgi:hypothetical protein